MFYKGCQDVCINFNDLGPCNSKDRMENVKFNLEKLDKFH